MAAVNIHFAPADAEFLGIQHQHLPFMGRYECHGSGKTGGNIGIRPAVIIERERGIHRHGMPYSRFQYIGLHGIGCISPGKASA